MSYSYRCNKCGRRFTLKRLKEQYIKERKCPNCQSFSIHHDKAKKKENKRKKCFCSGYPFPHRKGSAPFCRYSKRQPTEDELIAYGYAFK